MNHVRYFVYAFFCSFSPVHEVKRNPMRPTQLRLGTILAVVSLLAVPDAGQAGGLIQQLPADGSWVAFRAKSEFDLQGNLQTIDRELKLASVGKTEVAGEPARWIELSTELGGRRVVAK